MRHSFSILLSSCILAVSAVPALAYDSVPMMPAFAAQASAMRAQNIGYMTTPPPTPSPTYSGVPDYVPAPQPTGAPYGAPSNIVSQGPGPAIPAPYAPSASPQQSYYDPGVQAPVPYPATPSYAAVPASSPYAAAATTAYPTASATPQQAYGQQGYAQGPASYAQVPAPTPYADPNAGAYASAYGQAPAPQYGQYQQQYQQAPAPTYQQPQAYAAPAYPSYAPASQDQYQVAAAPSYPQAAYADPSQAYAQPYGTQSTYPQAGGPYASGGVPAYGATPSADYGSAYGTSYGAQPAQTQEAPAARGTTEASYAAEPLRRGFYFGMSSGVTIPTDATYTLSGAPVTTEYKTGWQLGTAVGYSFRPWGAWVQPRLEGELAYMQNSVDSHTIGGTKSSDPTAFGTLSVFSFLANTYLDFPVTRNFVPYISGGIGVGFVDIDRHGTNGTGVYLDDDGTGFTWQGGAGAAIGIGRFLMDVGYRYQQTMDIDVKPVSGATSSVDIGSHIIRIGFRQPF